MFRMSDLDLWRCRSWLRRSREACRGSLGCLSVSVARGYAERYLILVIGGTKSGRMEAGSSSLVVRTCSLDSDRKRPLNALGQSGVLEL